MNVNAFDYALFFTVNENRNVLIMNGPVFEMEIALALLFVMK